MTDREDANQLRVGGVAAKELIDEFGSPLYVYDETVLRQRIRDLRDAVTYPDTEIKYACKANTNLHLMRIIREEGLGIDAVSPGEIHAALQAGFEPERILLTVNNATPADMAWAVERGIMVNIDSLAQMEMFGSSYPDREVCVRINPNVGGGHHGHVITGGPGSKFGISYREVNNILETADRYGLNIAGVHQHIGSGILSTGTFIEAMDVLLETAARFPGLKFIDFGGGIGVPYRPEDRQIDVKALGARISREFAEFRDRYQGGGSASGSLKLIIEPGRYIVAECGWLLATVTSVKQGERYRFVGTDTGFNHLIRPAMYGSYHPMHNATRPGAARTPQVLAGNLCESGDTFTRDEEGIVERVLPEFRVGDVAAISHAGAYGFSMASQYCSRPRPAEVLVSGGSVRLVRRREKLEDIFDTMTGE